ncbi:MAG: tryptophanyl-tRNA synthetase [Actinomycetota bacterium]|nr:tryptophanyl-tRNA synthetase [Actinomycetota bacterium]
MNPAGGRADRRDVPYKTEGPYFVNLDAPAPLSRTTAVARDQRYASDGGYGTFKGAVAEAVVEYLRPVQARFRELDADRAEVDRRLAIGAGIAAGIADPVLARATKAAGLLPRAGS